MNLRLSRKVWLFLASTALSLAVVWIVSVAVAQGPDDGSSLAPEGGSAANAFSYQGRLLDNGVPVSGTYDFRAHIWDAGSQLGTKIVTCNELHDHPVEDGVFTLYLNPAVPPMKMSEVFNGQERWIEIEVRPGASVGPYTSLGRQPIAPAPLAWGLRSTAVISGDTGSSSGFGDAILNVDNTRPTWGGGNTASIHARASTGSAVRAESGGVALYGESTQTYAVRGNSVNGTAGYFTSDEGYGVYAQTDGTDHWDHGGYFRADMGYGVYAVSADNYGVRGEGYFGVRGDGEGTGVSGHSTSHTGVLGSSSSGYGVHGDSTDSRGVYGTSDNDVGVYGYTGSDESSGVVGVQEGYSVADLGGYWKPGGFFGGENGVVAVTKEGGGYGVYGWDQSSSGGWAGVFVSSNGHGAWISAPSGHSGLIVAGGSKNAVVPTSEGDRLLYTQESTEVWFSDYGFGQLLDGAATVEIDPLFAETVNLEQPYHVFLQVYGNAEIYVSERAESQFEVTLRDGDPSVEFSYCIMATRLDFEGVRLEPAPRVGGDPAVDPGQGGSSAPLGAGQSTGGAQ